MPMPQYYIPYQDISSRLRNYWVLVRRNFSPGRLAFSEYMEVFMPMKERLEACLGGEIHRKTILDIGCGQRCPLTLLFSNYAKNIVVGIDTCFIKPGISLKKYLNIYHFNGIERLFRCMVRELVFDKMFYQQLGRLAGFRPDFDSLRLETADATQLPYKDGSFDLVISNAVFEHIPDVEKAVVEMKRALKEGGVCYIRIHLYSSITGGHNLAWAHPDTNPPPGAPPWDHLRDKMRLNNNHVYLNKLREKDFYEIFSSNLKIVEWINDRYEGQSLLTPQIKAELKTYSEEELTKSFVVVIAQK